MGGNAIKSQELDRFTPEEFERISGDLTRAYNKFTEGEAAVIPAYSEKESHGDMDILIMTDPNHKGDRMVPIEAAMELVCLTPFEYVRNGAVASVGVETPQGRKFQIDFIFAKSWKEFRFSLHYFSYNDLGNLIGRIAHGMGLKFGHDGLWYVINNGDERIESVLLTDCYQKALDHLGFTPYPTGGFRNLEDIFQYVVSSRYFDPHQYPLEHRSNAARIRDRKRETYREFLKYVDYEPESTFAESKRLNKDTMLWYHVGNFPHLIERLDATKALIERRNFVKAKFSSEIISEARSQVRVEDKQFGMFIRSLKEGKDEMQLYKAAMLGEFDDLKEKLSVWSKNQ